MLRRGVVFILFLALVGCGRSREVATGPDTAPVTASDLSGRTYNLLSKNADESVILLGHLRFDPVQGSEVTGTWDLYQWGEPTAVPGVPGTGPITGTIEGSTLILRLALEDPQNSLGIVSDGFTKGRLSGKMSLLPSQSFTGTFEAIRSDQAQ